MELQLPVIGRIPVAGISGLDEVAMYLAQIYVPDLNLTIYGRFAGAHLAAGGQPHVALLGRSFLRDYTLTYEGQTGNVSISA